MPRDRTSRQAATSRRRTDRGRRVCVLTVGGMDPLAMARSDQFVGGGSTDEGWDTAALSRLGRLDRAEVVACGRAHASVTTTHAKRSKSSTRTSRSHRK